MPKGNGTIRPSSSSPVDENQSLPPYDQLDQWAMGIFYWLRGWPGFCKWTRRNAWTLFCEPFTSISIFLAIISILSIALVFSLSAMIEKSSCRTIAVNLFAANAVKHLIITVGNTAVIYDHFSPGVLNDVFLSCVINISDAACYIYFPVCFFTIQSLSMCSAVCAVQFPIVYLKYFNKRRWLRYYIGAHCAATTMAIVGAVYLIGSQLLYWPGAVIYGVLLQSKVVLVVFAQIGLLTLSIMIGMSISVFFRKSTTATTTKTSTTNDQYRKGLVAVLQYAMVSTVTMLPVFGKTWCDLYDLYQAMRQINVVTSALQLLLSDLMRLLEYLQPTLHAIAVIVCFAPYRQAMKLEDMAHPTVPKSFRNNQPTDGFYEVKHDTPSLFRYLNLKKSDRKGTQTLPV